MASPSPRVPPVTTATRPREVEAVPESGASFGEGVGWLVQSGHLLGGRAVVVPASAKDATP